MFPFLKGLGLGFSLIIAIGAQNAYVLKAGLRREHVFLIALTCFLCDAILISCGVLGMAQLVARYPGFMHYIAFIGALFLFVYGLKSFWSATQNMHLDPDRNTKLANQSKWQVVVLVLMLSLLNPHVYLDTVLLIGSVGASLPGVEKYMYMIGAVLASCLWFFGLGYGARLLQPMFQHNLSWKILDVLIGITMWLIAWSLLKPMM